MSRKTESRTTDIITADFKYRPYWWEAAPPKPALSVAPASSYDVVVVGSGYTGISAALTLARAGRSVVVFDSQDPGAGASRRNAGFLGRVLKKSYSELTRAKGEPIALAVYGELHQAYEATLDLIEEEEISCFAARPGRFIGATSTPHFTALRSDLELLRTKMGFEFDVISQSSQRDEMATSIYHGGVVIPDSGSLHPGLYHKGLLDRAVEAGAVIFGRTEVLDISRRAAGGFDVKITCGRVRAGDVVVGTNGYTARPGWYRRRVVPFRAYMAATEEMPPDVLAKLIPNNRTIIDTNTNIDFFRRAPDSPRILFGGATASKLDGPEAIATRLKAILDRALPDASAYRLSHVWDGYCAGTFDLMPHIGSRAGIHYGMGYNFSGITLGTAFGKKIAHKILGEPDHHSVFGNSRFPTLPLYTGNPWFLGMVMRYFAWRDRQIARG